MKTIYWIAGGAAVTAVAYYALRPSAATPSPALVPGQGPAPQAPSPVPIPPALLTAAPSYPVRTIQQALTCAGFPVDATGVWSAATEAAIRAWYTDYVRHANPQTDPAVIASGAEEAVMRGRLDPVYLETAILTLSPCPTMPRSVGY